MVHYSQLDTLKHSLVPDLSAGKCDRQISLTLERQGKEYGGENTEELEELHDDDDLIGYYSAALNALYILKLKKQKYTTVYFIGYYESVNCDNTIRLTYDICFSLPVLTLNLGSVKWSSSTPFPLPGSGFSTPLIRTCVVWSFVYSVVSLSTRVQTEWNANCDACLKYIKKKPYG